MFDTTLFSIDSTSKSLKIPYEIYRQLTFRRYSICSVLIKKRTLFAISMPQNQEITVRNYFFHYFISNKNNEIEEKKIIASVLPLDH